MELNHVREKGKPRCKILYKVSKEEGGYDPLLDIYPFKTVVKFPKFIGGIQNCVTVFGKCIFGRNITLVLPLTNDNIDYCCTNYDGTK